MEKQHSLFSGQCQHNAVARGHNPSCISSRLFFLSCQNAVCAANFSLAVPWFKQLPLLVIDMVRKERANRCYSTVGCKEERFQINQQENRTRRECCVPGNSAPYTTFFQKLPDLNSVCSTASQNKLVKCQNTVFNLIKCHLL